MAKTAADLGDVLSLALSGWAPGKRGKFGAAGGRGFAFQPEMDAWSRSVRSNPGLESTDSMRRMFSTEIGSRAANAVGNETRTLLAFKRISVEIMAMSMRLTGQARKTDRLLVVPGHHDGQPPVLMMLSPDVGAHESRLVSDEMDLPFRGLMIGLEEVADPGEDTPESVTLRQVLRGGPMALIEVFAIAQPEIVLTRRPRMIPLCAPSPHIPVKSGEKVSTAGILCRDADGDLGVTACYHGTGPVGTEVAVGLRKCRVKRADVVQDIVFIALGQGFNVPQIAGLNGVRADREPARSDRARFDGVSNQNTNTRIFGADAGLLRSRPTIMLKVQTDPDTDQGDSGSALLDENDKVLGFAFERTAYDDYPQFTDWIWAANALRALELIPYRAGG